MNNTVTLIDGTQVPSDSEAWRHECEARAIANLRSTAERRAWLESIEHRRGKEEADRLRKTLTALWKAKE